MIIRQTMKNALSQIPATDEEAFATLTAKDGWGYTKTQIAEFLGISKQAVSKWKTLPIKYVTVLHQKTGVPKRHLRPSDFA